MAIRLYLRDENRQLVRDMDQLYVPYDGSFDCEQFPMLCAVDEAGDLVLNCRQMKRALDEATQLLEEDLSTEERMSLEVVKQLCSEGSMRSGLYLWFFGE